MLFRCVSSVGSGLSGTCFGFDGVGDWCVSGKVGGLKVRGCVLWSVIFVVDGGFCFRAVAFCGFFYGFLKRGSVRDCRSVGRRCLSIVWAIVVLDFSSF